MYLYVHCNKRGLPKKNNGLLLKLFVVAYEIKVYGITVDEKNRDLAIKGHTESRKELKVA